MILTTPNWTAGRGVWPYHVREYTPAQLRKLCEPHGRCAMWKGTPDGSAVYPIRWTGVNDLFNRARATALVGEAARAVNRLVPAPARIHSHLAVILDVGAHAPRSRHEDQRTRGAVVGRGGAG